MRLFKFEDKQEGMYMPCAWFSCGGMKDSIGNYKENHGWYFSIYLPLPRFIEGVASSNWKTKTGWAIPRIVVFRRRSPVHGGVSFRRTIHYTFWSDCIDGPIQ